MLLDGRSRELLLQFFDIRSDMDGLNLAQCRQPRPCFTPAEERVRRAAIAARVFGLRILTVKNSRKRRAARFPEAEISAGSATPE
jgi:hypothetical protein